jgi:general secretion pathway protein A
MSVQAPAGNLYTSYFGLSEAPFAITPDPGYLYMSARHQEALAHLLFGISEGGGFVQLTGEIGTGKTTLCRYLVKQLPPHVDVALILNPRVTAGELLAAVCDELRIACDRAATTPKGFVDALYRYLLDAHGRGRKTVLVIDEAQNLAPEVLEQIRLLTNLETEKDKLLQIILIGQPELADVLASPQLRQLAQRITARYHLDPLSERETVGYVRHRLRIAGQKEQLFERGAIREVYRLSGGVPRLINVICDRALLGAWSRGEASVAPPVVRQAASEVLGRRVRHPQAIAVAGIVLAGVLLTVAGVAWRLGSERLWGLVGLGGEPAAPVRSEAGGTSPPPAAPAPVAARPAPPPAGEAPGPGAPASAAMGPAPDVAAASTERTGTPVPGLAAALERGTLHTDRRSAFRALYAAWGVPAEAGVEPGCDHVARLGLRCLFRVGTWYTLRRFDLPATLELLAPDGTRHFATVVSVDRDRATLAFGADRRTAGLTEIERLWDGQFLLLWRPPGVRTIPLVPGMRGRDVEWLRQRLAESDGGPASAADRELFDDELRERVVAFQASQALIPDGIVGEETLTRLAAAPGPAGAVPRLSGSGK